MNVPYSGILCSLEYIFCWKKKNYVWYASSSCDAILDPLARILLFDGSELAEQKQTTVEPALVGGGGGRSWAQAKLRKTGCDFSEAFLFHLTPNQLATTHVVVEVAPATFYYYYFLWEFPGPLPKLTNCRRMVKPVV